MRRRSSRTGMLAAALACALAAMPAAAQAAPAPSPEASAAALLDDTLAGALADTQPLRDLATGLGAGQSSTGGALAPVRDLLYDVAGTPDLPLATRDLVRQLADLLGTVPAGAPLDPAVLGNLSALLRDLAATDGAPATAAGLLTDVADLLDGEATGVTGQALAVPPQLIARLEGLLTALQDGDSPTGTLLDPVADLLETAAGTPGVSEPASTMLRQVAGALGATSGEADPLLAGQAARALRTIVATPGLTPQERIVIERVATALAQSSASGARAATRRDRAVVERIRLNRARTRIVVRVACPRSAPRACATRVTARLNGRKAARAKRVRIDAGRSKVVRLRTVPAARAASATRGGRLRVRVATRFGEQRFAHAKAVRVKARTA